MKKILLTIAIIVTFICTSEKASALIIYSNGLTCETHQVLPPEAVINGHHVNFGVAYEQFSIFWIPVWNYGTTYYAFISSNGKTIYEVDEEYMEELAEEYGIDFSSGPKISFWNKIGGKLVWIAILFLIFFGGKLGKKDKEEEGEAYLDSETEKEETTDSEELEEDEEDEEEEEEEDEK